MSEVSRQVDSFLASKILLGQKDCYIEEYRSVLSLLVDFCKKHQIDTLKAFGQPEFAMFLKECGINIRYKAESYIQKVLVLFRYLKRSGEVSHTMIEFKIVCKDPRDRKLYHDNATLKLIRSKMSSEFELVIFDLTMSTGISISEIHRLKREDINWSTGSTIIRDKSWKAHRTVYISAELLGRINKLGKISDEFAFMLTYNKVLRRRMPRLHINIFLRRIGRSIGININCSTLRNSFIIDFYNRTGDLLSLQKILGYKNFNFVKRRATKLYYKISPAATKEVFEYKKEGAKYVSTEDF